MKSKCAVLVEKNNVVVEELELPELKEGQVLVKIYYAGLCGTQMGEIRGTRGEDKYLPHLLGHEASGKVIEVGPLVSKVKEGDKVICSWMKSSGKEGGSKKYESKYSAGPITTFQEYSIISENRLIKISQSTDMRRAALFGCMIPTGVGSITNILRPEENSTLAIVGCGNIGSAAILGAKQFGCNYITAIDIDAKKRDYCYKLGATEFITSINRKYDYVLETTGNLEVIHKCLEMVNDSGRIVIVSNPNGKVNIDLMDINKGKIYGSWGGFIDRQNCYIEEFILDTIDFLYLDDVQLNIYPINDISRAIDDFDGVIGKILIEMK